MSDAHTPGPWTYEQRDGERHIHARNGESLQCDARYYPWVSGNEADWHLIAAAPELLEALQAFMATDKSFSTTCDRHLDEMAKEGGLAAVVKLARAAIAKATGEQS